MQTTKILTMGEFNPFMGIYSKSLITDKQKLGYLKELYGRKEISKNVYLDLALYLKLPEYDVMCAIRIEPESHQTVDVFDFLKRGEDKWVIF